MGMLEHKCDTCVGLGRIEVKAEQSAEPDNVPRGTTPKSVGKVKDSATKQKQKANAKGS
jgi:hypothetical protein